MDNKKKIVIAYHSIDGDNEKAVRGSFPITMERFKKQIELIKSKGWRFDFLSNINKPIEENTVYITGDDGTVDWVRNVLPFCEENKIPTQTAIITGPWLNNPIYPIAHRVQIALTIKDREYNLLKLTEEEKEYIDKVYKYETDSTRRYVKGCCNLLYDNDGAEEVLGTPGYEEALELSRRFAEIEEYKGYEYAEYGVHTVTHRAFDGDVDKYIDEEIIPCLNMLLKNKLKAVKYFTLPMRPMFNSTVLQLVEPLKSLGFDGIVDGNGHYDGKSFIIPRIDAKQVEEYFEGR